MTAIEWLLAYAAAVAVWLLLGVLADRLHREHTRSAVHQPVRHGPPPLPACPSLYGLPEGAPRGPGRHHRPGTR
ncbi:hypothetical protein ACFOOM_07745 [Streptomyces echinoruber]|uniref:Uncharacterized protein n=1 Tax=Streptomyces echinoruber TaxID=68898 RepID=A0A918R2R7_9ACTN|nr:hypothetical protein [Streptomyces echinoruber]GGZ80457.1 hypothetical protein GCM10010389_17880 [Streptomyces echinoruber]